MKYGELSLGQIEAIVNKLGGMGGVRRFLHNESLLPVEFEGHLKKVFAVWRSVELGTGLKNADDFRKALTDRGCSINASALDVFGEPAFVAHKTRMKVDLVAVSKAELGLKNSATWSEVYTRALEVFRLERCPAEVGPQLCLQNPPVGRFSIGIEPIVDSDGHLTIFEVGCSETDLWLNGVSGHPDSICDSHIRWVFVRRKATRGI